jgi:hypothetical protein
MPETKSQPPSDKASPTTREDLDRQADRIAQSMVESLRKQFGYDVKEAAPALEASDRVDTQ